MAAPTFSLADGENLLHATSVIIGGQGVLLRGDPGAGKTSLGLQLCRRARLAGVEAYFLADDQTVISVRDGVVIARCPGPLAGLVEIRGFGIVPHGLDGPSEAVIHCVVDCVDIATCDRVQSDARVTLSGVTISALRVPGLDDGRSASAVFCSLGLPVWM